MKKPHDNETCEIPFCKVCLAEIQRVAQESRDALGKALTMDHPQHLPDLTKGGEEELRAKIFELFTENANEHMNAAYSGQTTPTDTSTRTDKAMQLFASHQTAHTDALITAIKDAGTPDKRDLHKRCDHNKGKDWALGYNDGAYDQQDAVIALLRESQPTNQITKGQV